MVLNIKQLNSTFQIGSNTYNDYELIGSSAKHPYLSLSINLKPSITCYNLNNADITQIALGDQLLYAQFADAVMGFKSDRVLSKIKFNIAIGTLVNIYLKDFNRFQDKNPFTNYKQHPGNRQFICQKLQPRLNDIITTTPIDFSAKNSSVFNTNIANSAKLFVQLKSEFTFKKKPALFPEVTLSKLLHFINPQAFWLIDSKIIGILKLWGFPANYIGFGKLLTHLHTNHNTHLISLLEILRAIDLSQIGAPSPDMKLIDKVLFF